MSQKYSDTFQENKKIAFRRDGGRCCDCGGKVFRMHTHHITPKSQGGSDDADNLITLCPYHHAKRHNAHVCVCCGGILHDDSTRRAVYDKKGAAVTRVCGECFSRISNSDLDGCSICLTKDINETRYKAALTADCSPAGWMNICDKCREMLVFKPLYDTMMYFRMACPIDFAHWENSS